MAADGLSLLDALLRGGASALALLVAARLWREQRALAAARVGALLLLGLVVQVLGSMPVIEATLPWRWQIPLVAVAVANSVLFWLLARALFDDGFVLRPRHAGLWLAVAALALGIGPGGGLLPALAPALKLGLRWVPALMALAALWVALRHWRSDLVEARRQLRSVIVLGGAVYTVLMVGARLASPSGQLAGGPALADSALLLALLALIAAGLLRMRPSREWLGALAPCAPGADGDAGAGAEGRAQAAPPRDASDAPAPEPFDDTDRRLAAALDAAMAPDAPDAAWRTESLSLAALSARLAVPEYRLRRHINQRLGHRNFNAYVNGLRVAAAQRALADPALAARPILSIALDMGFGSIGPFNRAFKALVGCTPSEFRARAGEQEMADS